MNNNNDNANIVTCSRTLEITKILSQSSKKIAKEIFSKKKMNFRALLLLLPYRGLFRKHRIFQIFIFYKFTVVLKPRLEHPE